VFEEAQQYLEQGVVLARQIERRFLEFNGPADLAAVEIYRSFARAPSAAARRSIWPAARLDRPAGRRAPRTWQLEPR
jgi:hypothetical protein